MEFTSAVNDFPIRHRPTWRAYSYKVKHILFFFNTPERNRHFLLQGVKSQRMHSMSLNKWYRVWSKRNASSRLKLIHSSEPMTQFNHAKWSPLLHFLPPPSSVPSSTSQRAIGHSVHIWLYVLMSRGQQSTHNPISSGKRFLQRKHSFEPLLRFLWLT